MYVVTTYLFPLSIDNDDSVAVEVIIGSVLGACAVVVIVIVITLIIMRIINNKLAARVKSSNEYTGPPRVSRSYNLYVYVLHAYTYIATSVEIYVCETFISPYILSL